MEEINDYDEAKARWHGVSKDSGDPDLVNDARRQEEYESRTVKQVRSLEYRLGVHAAKVKVHTLALKHMNSLSVEFLSDLADYIKEE